MWTKVVYFETIEQYALLWYLKKFFDDFNQMNFFFLFIHLVSLTLTFFLLFLLFKFNRFTQRKTARLEKTL